MPRFNFTFQEASPLITYTGFWTEGNPQNDTAASQYSGSFRVTNDTTAKATLNFVGTGVSLFGGKRGNHGNYSVDLDHGSISTGNGFSRGGLFQQSLWSAYDLGPQEHTVEVDNESGAAAPYFDLDFVSIEREIGEDSDTVFLSTLDDTNPAVQYSGTWQPSATLASQNNNNTIHMTITPNAQLSITFQGCCIELYGLYANAAYMVSLDGQPPVVMQGMDLDLPVNFWHPQTLLYLMDGLSEDSNHTVTLEATQTSQQRPLTFDYALVRSTRNSTSSIGDDQQGNKSSSPQSTPLALILGPVVGGVLLLAFIGIVYLLLKRRRRRVGSKSHVDLMADMEGDNSSIESRERENRRPSIVTPWHRPSRDSNRSAGDLRNLQGRPGKMTNHNRIHTTPSSTSTPSTSIASNSSPRRKGQRDVAPSSSHSRQTVSAHKPQIQAEQDSGVVIELSPITLPPAYNPDWHRSR